MSQPQDGDRRVWMWSHGAIATDDGRLVGWSDPPLADLEGERRRARRFATVVGRAERVYCSDRRRARQAARPIARTLDARLEVTSALRDLDFGRWTGLTWREVRSKDPETHAAYMQAWHSTATPGGESNAELRQRVALWWRSLRLTGPVVVVGHTGSLRALAAEILGWGADDAMGVTLARGHYAVLDADGVEPPRWNLPLVG